MTPPFAGRPVTPPLTPAITPQPDPFAERSARVWVQPEAPTPEEEFVATQGVASEPPPAEPVGDDSTQEREAPEPARAAAPEPERQAAEVTSASQAEEDPFADWDAQLREETSGMRADQDEAGGHGAADEAAGAPAEAEWSDASFDLAGEAMRSLPRELSMPGSVGAEISLPESSRSPFDTTGETDAVRARAGASDEAEESGEAEEKVGLYGGAQAPLAADVVPETASGEPVIDAMPPELLRAYPSLQDTATHETQRPSGAIYAGEPAEAWAAATAGQGDPSAGDRAARMLERIAGRVRSGEVIVPDLAPGAGDAAVLAALLAAMLGGSRESGA